MALDKPIRVLVVEDNPSDRELSAVALSSADAAAFEIVTAPSLQLAVATLSSEKVDAVLLDLNLPDSSDLSTCQAVLGAAPKIPIIVLTGIEDEALGVAAVAMGAQDYLPKSAMTDGALSRAIRFAIERADRADGRTNGQHRHTLGLAPVDRLESLTPREREVLDMLIRGHTVKHIAAEMRISAQTVAKHRSRVLQKFGVNNDVELVRLMIDGDRAAN